MRDRFSSSMTAIAIAATGSGAINASAQQPWPITELIHPSFIVLPSNTRFPVARKITLGASAPLCS